MKFSCPAKQLTTALNTVMGAIPTKPNHPILAHVLLLATPQTIEVRAFDLNLGITAQFNAPVEVEGALTLPAKHLLNLIASLPKDEELSFEVELNQTEAILTSAGKRYTFRGFKASQFPQLPTEFPLTVPAIRLTATVLARGLKTTLFAATTDEMKPVLSGIRLTVEAEQVEFAATNGKVLAVVQDSIPTHENQQQSETTKKHKTKRKSLPSASSQWGITIPKTALKELQKLLGNPTDNLTDSEVLLHFNESQILFTSATFSLVCRALTGDYPDYTQLIPKQWSHEVTVSSHQLLAAVTRLATFDKHKIIRLVLNPTEQVISLYGQGQDIGSGAESLPALIQGEGLEIGFDADVLIPALKAIPTSEVRFSFNEANTPATLNTVANSLGTATVLVMPVELWSTEPPSLSSTSQALTVSSDEFQSIDTEPEEASEFETDSEDSQLELAALPM